MVRLASIMDESFLNRMKLACPRWIKKILVKWLPALSKLTVVRYIKELYYTSIINKFLSDFNAHAHQYIKHEKKIHYFIGSLRPGGAERQMANTALGIHDNNWDVIVSCEYLDTEEDRFYGTQLEARNITVTKLSKIPQRALLEAVDNKTLSDFLAKIIENKASSFEQSIFPYVQALLESKPQVVHAWLDQVNIRAGLAALIVGVPRIILSQRNVAPDNFLLYLPEMRPGYAALMQSPRVTMLNNSRAGAADYGRWLGISPDKIKVIYNGFYLNQAVPAETEIREFREKYHIPHNAPVVGGVFRFYEEKRPLFWLKIARKVLNKQPECYFILVGDGILLDKAKQLTANLKLSGRVIFTGLMKNVRPAMQSMDVLVLSSRKEGLPNVLIEAQYAGIPVIAPDVGGAAEALCEGKTGYAIEFPSAANMAEKILEVLGNAEFRSHVKQAGPEFISEKFGLQSMIKKTQAIYETRDVNQG